MAERKERQSNIEALRITAMLMIVCLHIMNHGGLLDAVTPNSLNYFVFWTLNTFCVVSVNVYVLISGYFLIDSQFSLKRLCAIVLEVLFYSVGLYVLFVLCGQVPLSLKGLVLALVPVKEYWFARVYVGLYCLTPVLNTCLQRLSRREWQMLIAVELLLFSLFVPATFLSISGGGIVWFVTLYTIAGYIRTQYSPRIQTPAKKYFGKYVLLMVMCAVLTLILKGAGLPLSDIFLRYNSLFILCGAVFLFLGFLQLPSPCGRVGSALTLIGGCTFGVYLLHDNSYGRVFLWKDLLHTAQMANYPVAIGLVLLIVCGVFISCALLDWVRGCLFRPLLRAKWVSEIDARAVRLMQRFSAKVHFEI